MDITTYLQFIAALAFVLALIGISAWLVRRFGLFGAMPLAGKGSKGRRLEIVESLALDGRRRLVLVRHEEATHLLLLSPTGETVIERSSTAASQPAASQPAASQPAAAPGAHGESTAP